MTALSPKDPLDPQDPLYYAPKWLRDRPERAPRTEVAVSPLGKLPAQGTAFDPRYATQLEDAVAKALQDPTEPVDYTPEVRQRRPVVGIAAMLVAAMAVAACTALLYMFLNSGSKGPTQTADGSSEPQSDGMKSVATAANKAPQAGAAPALLVKDGSGEVNEPLSLGVNVTTLTPGATVTLIGLPNGARLSPGGRASSGEWLIGVSDLPVATVIPPPDYIGPINIAAELRDGTGKAISKSPVQLVWKQAETFAPALTAARKTSTSASSPVAAESQPAIRQIPPEEVNALLRRGEEFARSGDLAAARLLLQRAAEAHNARAAFVLAATYDPIIIEKIAANSPMANIELARVWYQRAQDWGSIDAPKQLEALASMRR
jgi:hypothetical protein